MVDRGKECADVIQIRLKMSMRRKCTREHVAGMSAGQKNRGPQNPFLSSRNVVSEGFVAEGSSGELPARTSYVKRFQGLATDGLAGPKAQGRLESDERMSEFMFPGF
jgi:hypothetical protein